MRELFLLITLHFVPFPFWKGLLLGKNIYIKNRVHLHAYARKHETFCKKLIKIKQKCGWCLFLKCTLLTHSLSKLEPLSDFSRIPRQNKEVSSKRLKNSQLKI